MRLSSILSFTGFVLLFAGTYCPLLRPFYLFSWNVYKINQPYGLVLLLIAIVGIAASFLNQVKITRIAAWLSFALVVLLLVAALLKVQTAFSFIPFPKLDAFLSRQIKFRWGWWVLFAGPVIALAGALSGKPKAYIKPEEVSS
ncbi:hypothetical protein [Mucilaginibacter sp. SP1R1]|uniref:hypothetical protein n=1 Tax=Mucilaginibacter sp. SP1R1 TaxID=2723091 RepID=UPI00161AEAB2|nr:hypothetical protein [Mucilaginibacter sp. SP1R1]MBB6149214.1 putative membrane channel-forming protein YqfA (hemolysin III family) [Mucilaginibacter sp. SP1R1]